MPRSITAAVVREPGGDFELQQVELADPAGDEVLVRVVGVGLCHTDVAARDGLFGLPFPMVLGHEGSGIVEAVGPDVVSVAPGDHVAMSFNCCGTCQPCTDGQPAYCKQFALRNYGGGRRDDGSSPIEQAGTALTAGFFGQSSFASHALASERNVVKVDTDLPLELLGPLGCGIQTGAGAVFNSFDCREGQSLLVLGAGPVGLAAVMAAHVRGCTPMIVSEPDPRRRDLALSLGATAAIDPGAGPLVAQVHDLSPPGVDYAFDATGVVPVLEDSLNALAPRGTLGFVGVPHDMSAAMAVPIIPAMVSGWTVRGITEGDSDPKSFIPHLLDLHRAGQFPFDSLITTYPFADIDRAVQAQLRGEATKVVLVAGDARPGSDQNAGGS